MGCGDPYCIIQPYPNPGFAGDGCKCDKAALAAALNAKNIELKDYQEGCLALAKVLGLAEQDLQKQRSENVRLIAELAEEKSEHADTRSTLMAHDRTFEKIMNERDAALELGAAIVAAAKTAQCRFCKSGEPLTDIHNGFPAEYHGYTYRACSTPLLSAALAKFEKAQQEINKLKASRGVENG